MALDVTRYQKLFLEEAEEHLGEVASALIRLEKEPGAGEAVDIIFRMAHSVKSMSASLGYESVSELAHRMEDCVQAIRDSGGIESPREISLLFEGLDGLERMVNFVRARGSAPPPEPALIHRLSSMRHKSESLDDPAESAVLRASDSDSARVRTALPVLSSSVRVRTVTLDRLLRAVGEVILGSRQLRSAATEGENPSVLATSLDNLERSVGELQRRVMTLRTTPLVRVTEGLPRTARELAERLGKRVAVEVRGAEIEVDRAIMDRLAEPLLHVIRNAVDHGIEIPGRRVEVGKPEVGNVCIEARRAKDCIVLEVRDDGCGIDLEAVRSSAVAAGLLYRDLADDLPADQIAQLAFEPGLSTAQEITEISGRGVGLDAVKASVESMGGSVELSTEPGLGTTTTLCVPLAAAVQSALIVRLGRERIALAMNRVERVLEVPAEEVEEGGSESFLMLGDDPVLVLDLAELARVPRAEASACSRRLVLARVRGECVALRVDEFLGQSELYVKPVPEILRAVRWLSGVTVLEDGGPVFLLDLNHLI